jgi:hypothetical protein
VEAVQHPAVSPVRQRGGDRRGGRDRVPCRRRRARRGGAGAPGRRQRDDRTPLRPRPWSRATPRSDDEREGVVRDDLHRPAESGVARERRWKDASALRVRRMSDRCRGSGDLGEDPRERCPVSPALSSRAPSGVRRLRCRPRRESPSHA